MHLNVLLLCVVIFLWIVITRKSFYGSSFMTSDTSGFTVCEATTVIRQLWDTYCEIFGMKPLATYSFVIMNRGCYRQVHCYSKEEQMIVGH